MLKKDLHLSNDMALTPEVLEYQIEGRGATLLHLIAMSEEDLVPLLERVLATGVDVNVSDAFGLTPLFWAKTAEIAQLLIDAGADVNRRDRLGRTAMFEAQDAEIAQVLFDAGADPGVHDYEGYTPLHKCFSEDVARWLIDHGVDPNVVALNGRTPIFSAGCAEVAQVLVDSGADLHWRDIDGNSPLHSWLKLDDLSGKDEMPLGAGALSVIYEAGAEIDAKNNAGLTPLLSHYHLTDGYGMSALTHLLLSFGADVHAVDPDGHDALWHEERAWHDTLMAFELCEAKMKNFDLLIQRGAPFEHGARRFDVTGPDGVKKPVVLRCVENTDWDGSSVTMLIAFIERQCVGMIAFECLEHFQNFVDRFDFYFSNDSLSDHGDAQRVRRLRDFVAREVGELLSYIDLFYVRKSWRGQGIGRALFGESLTALGRMSRVRGKTGVCTLLRAQAHVAEQAADEWPQCRTAFDASAGNVDVSSTTLAQDAAQNRLVRFYQNAGFEVIIDYGHVAVMGRHHVLNANDDRAW